MADSSSRSGKRYDHEALQAYVDSLHARHDEGLAAAFAAPAREGLPQIQVGRAEGALIALLLSISGAKRVVEIGTLAGYSAIWIARALGADGHLFSLEREPAHARVARAAIAAAGLADRVTVIEGEALANLASVATEGPFDAVFVDADKGNYDRYGIWASSSLRPSGLLIADNAFFFGRLLEEGPEAAAMRRFHERAAIDFETACVPTPDGLLIGVRRPQA